MDPTKFTIRRSAFSPGNAIFIIDCLSERDLQTGRSRLRELHDLLLARDPERFEYNKNFARRFEASSAARFAECFAEISSGCELGIRPIIFIDAHGHCEKGLGTPSGEYIGWDKLLNSLDSVNQRTGGELTVIVAACHSMKAVEKLSHQKRLPFAFYYGYSSEVKAGVVNKETELIYKSFFNDGGQRVLDATSLQLKSFSEYDYVTHVLAVTLLSAKAPDVLAQMLPNLSRAQLRATADEAAVKKGLPLSGSRAKVNHILNSGLLAINLVEQLMHDTPRRGRVIQDIQAYIQGTPAPAL